MIFQTSVRPRGGMGWMAALAFALLSLCGAVIIAADSGKAEASVTKNEATTPKTATLKEDASVRETNASVSAVEVALSTKALEIDLELPVVRGAADAVNAFSVDLFKKAVSLKPGNLVMSPYSLECALATVAFGARGETREEMLEVLRMARPYPVRDEVSVHAPFALLSRHITGAPSVFTAVNRFVAAKDLNVRHEYTAGIGKLYNAETDSLDFTDLAAAMKNINSWAAGHTNGMIREIVSESNLAADTRMVVLNAVLFKGEWANAFLPEQTRPGKFMTAMGEADVQFMNRSLPLLVDVIRAPQPQPGDVVAPTLMAAIPFKDGAWDMVFFLPSSMDDFLVKLTPESLCSWLADYDAKVMKMKDSLPPIALSIPKFSFSSDMGKLSEMLKNMGIVAAFSSDKASFDGIARGRLCLSEVLHKARIEVGEAGVTASAMSAVMGGKGMPEEFVLERPFVFLVRETKTGAVVMFGLVAQPVIE